jgi:putative glycosyltransferase (TIGR04372 family)
LKIKILGKRHDVYFIIYKLFTSKNYNLFNLIIYLFKIIIGILFLLVIIVLYPAVKIKIIQIETRAIGHYSIPIEIFLSEIMHGYIIKKKTFFLCFTNEKIANEFLLKKWKHYLFIKNIFFIEFLFIILNKYYFFGKYFLLPYRHWQHHKFWQNVDIYNLLPKTKPFINFTEKEIIKGNLLLNKIGISNSNNYICFFARDSKYRNEKIDNQSVRNSNINDQLKGIDFIVNDNFKAVRIGSEVEGKLKSKNKNIIDYPLSNLKSDFLDIYLIFHSKFIIGTGSGIEDIAVLNRKKILTVNFASLAELYIYSSDFYRPIIVPKKYINLRTNQIMTFKEIFQNKIHHDYHSINSLKNMGYGILSNSEDEIKNAIVEMNNFVDSKNEVPFINDNKNKEFWDIYEHYHKYRPNKWMQISKNFLETNSFLLK